MNPAIETKASFLLQLDRESVCMGDDAMSHKEIMSFPKDIKISSFIEQLADYVPKMKSSVWLVWGEREIIGYIDFDTSGHAKIEVEGEDRLLMTRFSTSEIPSITCIYYYSGKFSWVDDAVGDTLLEKVKTARREQVSTRTL